MIKEIVRIATTCKKCGVTLCEKNEMFNQNQTYKMYRMYICKHCWNGVTYCRVVYKDPELKTLSQKKNILINAYCSKRRNIDRRKLYVNAKNAKEREQLSDIYIIKVLLSDKKKLFKSTSEITPELIEIKRKQLKIHRMLNEAV
jgi:hypothetical protein